MVFNGNNIDLPKLTEMSVGDYSFIETYKLTLSSIPSTNKLELIQRSSCIILSFCC